MKFVRAISGYYHLWAVRDEAKEADELTLLFREWSNANYLLDFFLANIDDLQGFFHVEKISDAIKDTMEDARLSSWMDCFTHVFCLTTEYMSLHVRKLVIGIGNDTQVGSEFMQ